MKLGWTLIYVAEFAFTLRIRSVHESGLFASA